MHRARNNMRAYSQDTSISFDAHGGSLTNRGTSNVTVNGSIVLEPKESYQIPVIGPHTKYDQELNILFDEGGENKVVVQFIEIAIDPILLPETKNC